MSQTASISPTSEHVNGMRVDSRREIWRWSVEQFQKLFDFGILRDDDPVELVDGRIRVKSDYRSDNGGGVVEDLDWRWTIEQYHAMIDAGILTADDPVELLDGEVVPKMPINPAHRLATRRFFKAIAAILPSACYVDMQHPLAAGESEPEPDISVIRGIDEDYANRHPGPMDSWLVIEVSQSTLHNDRNRKKHLYARALVPVYWIVNLKERQVEVYTEPSGPCDVPDYRQSQIFGVNDELPVVIDGSEVGRLKVGELLP